MSNSVTVTSAVKLSESEITSIRNAYKLSTADEIKNIVDSNLIAGIKVEANGQTVDLSVSRQLGEI